MSQTDKRLDDDENPWGQVDWHEAQKDRPDNNAIDQEESAAQKEEGKGKQYSRNVRDAKNESPGYLFDHFGFHEDGRVR